MMLDAGYPLAVDGGTHRTMAQSTDGFVDAAKAAVTAGHTAFFDDMQKLLTRLPAGVVAPRRVWVSGAVTQSSDVALKGRAVTGRAFARARANRGMPPLAEVAAPRWRPVNVRSDGESGANQSTA